MTGPAAALMIIAASAATTAPSITRCIVRYRRRRRRGAARLGAVLAPLWSARYVVIETPFDIGSGARSALPRRAASSEQGRTGSTSHVLRKVNYMIGDRPVPRTVRLDGRLRPRSRREGALVMTTEVSGAACPPVRVRSLFASRVAPLRPGPRAGMVSGSTLRPTAARSCLRRDARCHRAPRRRAGGPGRSRPTGACHRV